MGRQIDAPRYNIISMRVNDEERDLLQHLATRLSINMSEMMRRAMQNLKSESCTMQLNR